MATDNSTPEGPSRSPTPGITSLSVSGFKSIGKEQTIEVRPLTILAGANSAGKSSIVQPALLLKQTLEATYDPGPLLLNGPNVKFTSMDQLLSRAMKGRTPASFMVGISIGTRARVTVRYGRQPRRGIEIQEMESRTGHATLALRPGMTSEEIQAALPQRSPTMERFLQRAGDEWQWRVKRSKCFLTVELTDKGDAEEYIPYPPALTGYTSPLAGHRIGKALMGLIHVPGLRGNPERVYPVTAVGSSFPGTFESYVASTVAQWQREKKDETLEQLGDNLARLGLTWKVIATPISDTQVELQVGRLPRAARGGARDLVNIADVGFGVSQTLPVLVALLAAKPGQLVYLEQPEIHLHPRAQTAMAGVIAAAALRGVRVLLETHSNLFLLGVQSLVAEGSLSPELVKLHWFRRQEDGTTEVTSADLDQSGAFGDWPEDFAEVTLQAESRFLDAVEARPQRS